MSDERASAVSGGRVRTGQSARMCGSMVCDVSDRKPSPTGRGSSNCCVTKSPRLNCGAPQFNLGRSEEHTSELQSRSDLVCRLLLEKKKKKKEQQRRCDSMTRTSLEET